MSGNQTASEQGADKKGLSNRDAGRRGRNFIAQVVVVASFLSVFLMGTVVLVLAKKDAGNAASQAAEKAFNAILPVVAGWMGTVLAFYFSAASQEHTNDILEGAIERSAARPGDGVAVSAKMIPVTKVLRRRDLKQTPPSEIKLEDLKQDFKTKADGVTITRLLFLENDAFRYIVHVGALNQFLVDHQAATGSEPSPGTHRGTLPIGASSESSSSRAELTLADLLKDETILNQVSKLVVFVSATTTLADAKVALDKMTGAQDIIVTATGNSAEPMLGWLTNVDLIKVLTVN